MLPSSGAFHALIRLSLKDIDLHEKVVPAEVAAVVVAVGEFSSSSRANIAISTPNLLRHQ